MRILLLVLGLAMFAGPPALAQGGASFDGTWVGRGTLSVARHQGARCGAPEINGRLAVQGGVLGWEYSPRDGVRFSGPVGPDGSFDIASGQHRFRGRFSATGMRAEYSGPACTRDWGFRRGGAG